MEFLTKVIRVGFYTLIIGLLIGVANFSVHPILWAFLFVVFATRVVEVFSPTMELMSNPEKREDQPLWLNWLMGIIFLTNLILPILDFRYRGQVFWTSPMPAMPWWSLIGLAIMIGGAVLRIRSIIEVSKKSVSHIQAMKDNRKKQKKEDEVEEHKNHILAAIGEQRYLLHYGTLLFYFGIAAFFTSLWALLALLIVVLPVAYARLKKDATYVQGTHGAY